MFSSSPLGVGKEAKMSSSTTATIPAPGTDSDREKGLTDYRKKLWEHKELEARLKESMYIFESI